MSSAANSTCDHGRVLRARPSFMAGAYEACACCGDVLNHPDRDGLVGYGTNVPRTGLPGLCDTCAGIA